MEKDEVSTQLMYKPLPESLTIKTSKVNGLGLFAQEGIAQGTNLGMTHIKINEKIIRTPLGGFINHANDANCVKVELLMTNHDDPEVKFDYKKWNLITLRDIKKEEELTLRYTFYDL
jgi:SET domain-containing protein